jgi:hypothetical protein
MLAKFTGGGISFPSIKKTWAGFSAGPGFARQMARAGFSLRANFPTVVYG